MQKTMTFIDYQNFNINMKNYYNEINEEFQNINYSLLAKEICTKIPISSEIIKTYLFAYRPCDKLLELDNYKKYYNWLCSIKNSPYFEVIEGIQEIRYYKDKIFDINKSDTYTTEEKGTDINIAVHMLSKAYQNSYDIAVLISGDTDYVPVVEVLHQIGKIVVLATFPKQNISKYKNLYDQHISIDKRILQNCIPKQKFNNKAKIS